jgi:hypothetical protein
MKFKQRGYILEGAEGESPWESGVFPLSLVGNVGMDITGTDARTGEDDRERTTVSQFRQNAVEFHSAGTLAKQVTFHFDSGFSTDTGLLENGMAFVQFDELARGGALNLRAGIYDAEVPYLSSARRTTQADYLTPVTLDGQGFELNGAKPGWTYAIGLINSGRTRGAPSDRLLNRLEDTYLWVMHEVGGQLVAARAFLDRQDPRTALSSVALHAQFDLSAQLTLRRLTVIPAYVLETHSDPDSETPNRVHHGLLEAMLPLGSQGRWVATGRYEIQHVVRTALVPESDLWLAAVNAGYYVNPAAKLGLEWAHLGNNAGAPFVDEVQAFVHVGF